MSCSEMGYNPDRATEAHPYYFRGKLVVAGGAVGSTKDYPSNGVLQYLGQNLKDVNQIGYLAVTTSIPQRLLRLDRKDIQRHGGPGDRFSFLTTDTFNPSLPLSVKKESVYEFNHNGYGDTIALMCTGGDQARSISRLTQEDLSYIKGMLVKGGIIFTTSATSMLLSRYVVVPWIDGYDLQDMGWKILPDELIVDTHFQQRNRGNRMIDSMWKAYAGYGVQNPFGLGFDEKTAGEFAWQNGQFVMKVIGDGAVHIYDGTKLQDGSCNRYFTLEKGEGLNIITRRPIGPHGEADYTPQVYYE